MAISKVKKLELIAHAQHREEILKALRKLGAVHISNIRDVLPESQNETPAFIIPILSNVESKLEKARYCLRFIQQFVARPSFAEALLKPKPIFTEREAEQCLATFDLDKFHSECTAIERELAEIQSQRAKNQALMEDISYWSDLACPLESIRNTQTAYISLGISEARTFNAMVDELSEASPLFHIEIVERSRTSVSMIFICAREVEDVLTPILRQYGWHAVKFPGLMGVPADVAEGLREKCEELLKRSNHLRNKIVDKMAPSRNQLLLLSDHYTQELQTLKVQQNMLFTSRAFLITGWIIAKEEEELLKRLHEVTNVVDLRLTEPEPDDTIPILLENNRLVKPFSLITEMYGHPQYTEFDPTPLFAPFFVLFFAICLGDAGYGLILALGSYFALKKFEIYGGARKLLQILFIGGIANIVIGLLTGGVFAMEPDKLPAIFNTFKVFTPTKQVVLFLYISFAIGVFQVLFGLGVKLVHNIKRGKPIDAALDQGLWILFLISLVPLVFKYIFGGSVSENIIITALYSFPTLGVALVFTQGRKDFASLKIKRFRLLVISLLRGGMGLLKLYDTMGYFSDVLSYARLMALGLATAFLGMAFNQMAKMSMDIPYGIGYVIGFLILVFSHIFNLVINCLGAFVHSLRLQYLEFFSKFFTGGGEPFTPFAETREFTVIQSGLEKAQQEQ